MERSERNDKNRKHLRFNQSTDTITYVLRAFIATNNRYPSTVGELTNELNSLVRDDVENNHFSRGFVYSYLKRQGINTDWHKNPNAVTDLTKILGIPPLEYAYSSETNQSSEEYLIKEKSTEELLTMMSDIAIELASRYSDTSDK